MSPIPLRISSCGSSRPSLSSLYSVRRRLPARVSDKVFHKEKWVPEVFRPEELQPEDLQLVGLPSNALASDLLPQQLRSSQLQPEHSVPRQVPGENPRARGGGGSSSSGGSQGSSGSSRGSSSSSSSGFAPAAAPAPQSKPPGPGSSSPWGKPVKQPLPAAPKPAPKPVPKLPVPKLPVPKLPVPKLPVPAPPYGKPAPPALHPAPDSGSKPPKPKSATGPSIVPDVKPKSGKLPKAPERPATQGNKPHTKVPHTPAVGSGREHGNHGDSNRVGGCNVRCRNALLGTFSALTLLGLLALILFCIFCRRKASRRRDTERGRRSKSYPDGQRWWKQGRDNSRAPEDGMELTTRTARGVQFTMSQERLKGPQVHNSERSTGSYDRGIPLFGADVAMHREELRTSPYGSEMPIPVERSQMRRQERSTGSNDGRESISIRSDRSINSCPAIMTVRSTSPCPSCTQMHSQEQSTSSSGVRRPMSIESDGSSWEAPVIDTARKARIVPHPPPISMIAGMEGFRAENFPLQRRSARRNSDRPDMSESSHQSVASQSSGYFTIGEDSDEADGDDARTVTDDDDTRIATDDEYSRGRTSQRKSHGSARKRRDERLRRLSKEQVLKHADSGLGGSDSGFS